jgi:hypothetical protein
MQERRDAGLTFRIVGRQGQQHADPPHPVALLRPRRERPCRRRAAEQRDELAAFYLIELHFGPRARAGLLDIELAANSQRLSGGFSTAGRDLPQRSGWARHDRLTNA